jgi:CMP-N-acetylneuraminic acid synthetase
MSCYAFIFSRGGSKGVKRKNIKLLEGKPLIAYSIEAAEQSQSIQKVFVSTEDSEIAFIAKRYGAEVIERPSCLAEDESPEWLAWQHAVEVVEARYGRGELKVFVSLPATSPLRIPGDIDRCIDKFVSSQADVVITGSPAKNNPYFCMVKEVSAGYVELLAGNGVSVARRQDAPCVYDMNGAVYVTSPSFIMENNRIFDGKVELVEMPRSRSVDIDTELDFKFAEFLLSEQALV